MSILTIHDLNLYTNSYDHTISVHSVRLRGDCHSKQCELLEQEKNISYKRCSDHYATKHSNKV